MELHRKIIYKKSLNMIMLSGVNLNQDWTFYSMTNSSHSHSSHSYWAYWSESINFHRRWTVCSLQGPHKSAVVILRTLLKQAGMEGGISIQVWSQSWPLVCSCSVCTVHAAITLQHACTWHLRCHLIIHPCGVMLWLKSWPLKRKQSLSSVVWSNAHKQLKFPAYSNNSMQPYL